MVYAIAFYAASILADIWTTRRGLQQNPRAIEANPIVRKLIDWFGNGWWVAKLAGQGAVMVPPYLSGVTWPMWILGVVMFAVAINNYRIGND